MAKTMRRNWVDLSGRERQHRLTIFAGIGVALLLCGALAFSLSGSDGKAQAAETAASPAGQADITAWFEGTAAIRGEVMEASTAVRTYMDDNDGLALQPACTTLRTQAALAAAHPSAPDSALQTLWVDGTTQFTKAAEWCGKLWDGTPMAPPAILAEVTGALDSAEASWGELASRAGQPLPALPSGTSAPLDGSRRATSPSTSTSPTPAPVAPRATATAATVPTPTGTPGAVPPSITLPTFDPPPTSTAVPGGIPTSPTGG